MSNLFVGKGKSLKAVASFKTATKRRSSSQNPSFGLSARFQNPDGNIKSPLNVICESKYGSDISLTLDSKFFHFSDAEPVSRTSPDFPPFLQSHTESIQCLSLSSDGKYLFSCSFDNTIKQFEIATGFCIKTFLGHSDKIDSIVIDSKNQTLWSCSKDLTLKHWDISSGKVLSTIQAHAEWITCVTLTKDDKFLFSCSFDGTIKKWNTDTKKCVLTIKAHKNAKVNVLLLAPDNNSLFSASDTIKEWDTTTGNLLNSFKGHKDACKCLAIHPNGEELYSAGSDKLLKVWDLKKKKLQKTIKTKCPVFSIISSYNHLLTANFDKNIQVWDIISGKSIQSVKAHKDYVRCLALSGDNIFSGSGDTTIKHWRFTDPKNLILKKTFGLAEKDTLSALSSNILRLSTKSLIRIIFLEDDTSISSVTSFDSQFLRKYRIDNFYTGSKISLVDDPIISMQNANTIQLTWRGPEKQIEITHPDEWSLSDCTFLSKNYMLLLWTQYTVGCLSIYNLQEFGRLEYSVSIPPDLLDTLPASLQFIPLPSEFDPNLPKYSLEKPTLTPPSDSELENLKSHLDNLESFISVIRNSIDDFSLASPAAFSNIPPTLVSSLSQYFPEMDQSLFPLILLLYRRDPKELELFTEKYSLNSGTASFSDLTLTFPKVPQNSLEDICSQLISSFQGVNRLSAAFSDVSKPLSAFCSKYQPDNKDITLETTLVDSESKLSQVQESIEQYLASFSEAILNDDPKQRISLLQKLLADPNMNTKTSQLQTLEMEIELVLNTLTPSKSPAPIKVKYSNFLQDVVNTGTALSKVKSVVSQRLKQETKLLGNSDQVKFLDPKNFTEPTQFASGGEAIIYRSQYYRTDVILKRFHTDSLRSMVDSTTTTSNPVASKPKDSDSDSDDDNWDTESSAPDDNSQTTTAQESALIQRFWRSNNILSALNHPNIVRYFGCILSAPVSKPGKPFSALVIEFCPGSDLLSLIRYCNKIDAKYLKHRKHISTSPNQVKLSWLTSPSLPFSRIVSILVDIATGLEYLHLNKILHRDIKPSNLLISSDKSIKIADFGVAKSLSKTLTSPMTFAGTLAYMAPEVFDGAKNQSFPSDVYSFGLVAFHLITGRVPFENSSLSDTQKRKTLGSLPAIDDTDLFHIRCDRDFLAEMKIWIAPDPNKRPSITQILISLQNHWASVAAEHDAHIQAETQELLANAKSGGITFSSSAKSALGSSISTAPGSLGSPDRELSDSSKVRINSEKTKVAQAQVDALQSLLDTFSSQLRSQLNNDVKTLLQSRVENISKILSSHHDETMKTISDIHTSTSLTLSSMTATNIILGFHLIDPKGRLVSNTLLEGNSMGFSYMLPPTGSSQRLGSGLKPLTIGITAQWENSSLFQVSKIQDCRVTELKVYQTGENSVFSKQLETALPVDIPLIPTQPDSTSPLSKLVSSTEKLSVFQGPWRHSRHNLPCLFSAVSMFYEPIVISLECTLLLPQNRKVRVTPEFVLYPLRYSRVGKAKFRAKNLYGQCIEKYNKLPFWAKAGIKVSGALVFSAIGVKI